jgi:hypothetical protein
MRLRTAFLATSIALASLACGGAATTIEIPTEDLTAPWTEMKIPVGDGAVVLSDDTEVRLTYQNADVEDLLVGYSAAVTGAGWEKVKETEAGGAKTIQYKKDGETLSLNVAESMGFTAVSINIFPF